MDQQSANWHEYPAIREFLTALDYYRPTYPDAQQARYVATFWQAAGDEAMHADGRVMAQGDWPAYLAYVDHPRVYALIGGYRWQLGSSEMEATHWLVFDLQRQRGAIIPIEEAESLLRSQWPQLQATEDALQKMSKEEFDQMIREVNQRLVEEFSEWKPAQDFDIQAHMAEQQRRIEAMLVELNRVSDVPF